MHLSGLSRDALRRLQKFAQWEVDESGQAVPMGTPEAQGAPGGDVENRLSTLEQMIKEYGATFQEWVDYLSQYNKGLADSLSAIWTDVNTIGNDVDQLRQEKQQTALQTTPQAQPQTKRWPVSPRANKERKAQEQLRFEVPTGEEDLVSNGIIVVENARGEEVSRYSEVPLFDTIPVDEAMNYISAQEPEGSRFFCFGKEGIQEKSGHWRWNDVNNKIGQEKIPSFWGEIEILEDQRTAIVTLYDEKGKWAGSGRIENKWGDAESLYEDGYNKAVQNAAVKGGRLERFTRVK